CIVDENVEAPEFISRRRDQPLAIVRLGDVGRDHENGAPAFLLDRLRRTDQRPPGAPGDRDPRALPGEGAGDRKADSSAPAGDDGDLAVELRLAAHAIDWKRWASALMCFAV